jgi:allantoin racemase
VLDLETSADARQRVLDQILTAKREDGCESIVLGCAGMADLARWLSDESGLPVIDGVVAGVKIMEALIGTGLKTSKVGAYAAPRRK